MSYQQQPTIQSGSTSSGVEILNLTKSSEESIVKYQNVLIDLEIKKIAATLTNVPTLPNEVRFQLRSMGLPVRFFGENLANVRDRLRYELAKLHVYEQQQQQQLQNHTQQLATAEYDTDAAAEEDEEEEVTKYTRATTALIGVRKEITKFSIERAKQRLQRERKLRYAASLLVKKRSALSESNNNSSNNIRKQQQSSSSSSSETTDLEKKIIQSEQSSTLTNIIEDDDNECYRFNKSIQQITVEGTQYGDTRALSSIACYSGSSSSSSSVQSRKPLVVTASWTGNFQVWDGRTPALRPLVQQSLAHTDRIMNIAIQGIDNTTAPYDAFIATASIDLTAKLWKLQYNDSNDATADTVVDDTMDDDNNDANENTVTATTTEKTTSQSVATSSSVSSPNNGWTITEWAHYKGHKARLCRVAFHPMKQHIATTSFDHSWRLWDINRYSSSSSSSSSCNNNTDSSSELLLQDGHCCEVYGIGFHPDGSLCATTDYAGIVQLWDLRSGKSIRHYMGHTKRILNAEFHPINGYHLATAGDDGTIRIWDLRKQTKGCIVSIPAHSNLISCIKYDPLYGEYIISSSFDGMIKLWNTRNYKLIHQFRAGHEGKISSVDILYHHHHHHHDTTTTTATKNPYLSFVSCGFDKTLKMWR